MIVKIHDIAASCPSCGAGEFEPLSPEPLRLASTLECSVCRARYTYLRLIDQIGEEAMRRLKTLDGLQRKKPPN